MSTMNTGRQNNKIKLSKEAMFKIGNIKKNLDNAGDDSHKSSV